MSGNLRLEFVIEAIDNATRKVKAVNDAVERAAEPMRRVKAASRELFQELGWGKLQRQMDVIRQKGAGIVDTVRGMAVGLAAVTAATGAAFFGIKRTVDVIDRANDTAAKLGITVEVFQRMAYLAQMNGSSEDEMAGALQHLARSAGEAARGGKEALTYFAAVGLTAERLKGMNVAQIWEAIGEKFAQVGDHGQNARKKLELLFALTGRSSTGLVQALNLGKKGMQQFYDEADRIGAVVSGETAKAMADFNDNFDRLTFSIRGVVAMIAQYALPHFDRVVKKFTEMNVASRAAIGRDFGTAIGQIVEALPAFLTGLGQFMQWTVEVAPKIDKVAQFLGGWGNVLKIIAGLFATKLVVQLISFGASVAAAVPTIITLGKAAMTVFGGLAAFLAAPLGIVALLTAALVGAAAAVIYYWEPISAFFEKLWGRVKSVASGVARWFGGGGAQSAAPSAAVPSAGGSNRSMLYGRIDIGVDSQGRAVVRDVQSNQPGLALDAYTGATMSMP